MINFRFVWILAFNCLILVASPSAQHWASGNDMLSQQATITAKADRNSIDIADPFTLTVEVTAAHSSTVQFPQIGNKIGPFDVISHRDQFGIPIDRDTRSWIRTVELETILTGDQAIPSIEVVVKNGQKESQLRTDPVVIKVKSVLEANSNPQSFQDIRSTIDAPIVSPGNHRWMFTASAGIAGFALLAGVILIARKPRRKLTPAQWALTELANPQTECMADFDSILRNFLQHEFGFAAPSQTPLQIENQLGSLDVDTSTRQSIQTFFEDAQQVRFAGRDVNDDQLDAWRSKLNTIVQNLNQLAEEKK